MKEEYADSPAHMFEEQMYRVYSERFERWERLTKEKFMEAIKILDVTPHSKILDKNNIYRVADEKCSWITRSGVTIGESWTENGHTIYYLKIKR